MAAPTRQQQVTAAIAVMDKQEPLLAAAFAQGVNALRDNIVLTEVAAKLGVGDWQGAAAFLTPQRVGAALSGYLNTMVDTYHLGAGLGAAANPSMQVFFSTASTASAQVWERYQQQRIVQITQETSATINQIVQRGLLNGSNPLAIAREIRANIGLTPTQEAAVNNFRTLLQTRPAMALQRTLRDQRYDPTVARAARDSTPLTADQIDTMVGRYRAKYLQLRSQNIARTETTGALSQGNHAFYQQAINQGEAQPGEMRRFWVYTHDSKTRLSHRLIPSMNPNGVGMDEAFATPLGPLMYPGDPAGDPANVINCRCTLLYRRSLT